MLFFVCRQEANLAGEPDPRLKLLWTNLRRGLLLLIHALDSYFGIDTKMSLIVVIKE